MLVSKTVKMKWNSINKNHYISKGYDFTKVGDVFDVRIEDLSENSIVHIKLKCDICGKPISRKYQDYRLRNEKEKYKIDSCSDCRYEKIKMVRRLMFENNELTKGFDGYYSFKENRLKELNEYIKQHHTIDQMKYNPEGKKLYSVIKNYNEEPYKLALELGYSLSDIMKYKPTGWYDDFDHLKNDILKLIKKYNRFPTQAEIISNLKVPSRVTEKHGGMYEIKRKMNYNDEGDLVDDSGYFNMSSYEYILAQWLLNNTKIKYKRNVIINKKDGNYNCDFVLYPKSQEPIWVEVWGGLDGGFHNYKEIYEIKTNLYNKYNKRLISIYPNVFYKNYNEIQETLYKIFKPYIDLEYEHLDINILMPPNRLSDDEILKEVLLKSKNKEELPPVKSLRVGLYKEILKRFGDYTSFAKYFNKKVISKTNKYWTDEKFLEVFLYMANKYGEILNRGEIIKYINIDNEVESYSKISNSLNQYGGLIYLKFNYFEHCLINNIIIPDKEIKWLYSISNYKRKKTTTRQIITEDYQNKAQLLFQRILENSDCGHVMNIAVNRDKWSKDKAIEILNEMIETEGKILTETDCNKHENKEYKRVYSYVTNTKQSIIDLKFECFNYRLLNNLSIPIHEQDLLNDLITDKGRYLRIKVTSKQKEVAKRILEKILLIKAS